jgi:hypothetical protein
MAGEFNIKNGFKSNGDSTVSGRLTTQKLTITSGATNGYVLTSDASGNASWQAQSLNYSLSGTGTNIHFSASTIFGSSTTPETGNITNTLTNSKLGVVQKIYHNSGSAPTVPAGWVLLGSTTYQISTLNIIYAEWAMGNRVEYWIVR